MLPFSHSFPWQVADFNVLYKVKLLQKLSHPSLISLFVV